MSAEPFMSWRQRLANFVKPDEQQLRQSLTELQFRVTQQSGTETSFNNLYCDHHQPGIYVDSVSSEPLFASVHKYDSRSGWPSFFQTLPGVSLRQLEDRHLFSTRTEIRSAIADSHLGHVFADGPAPTGTRYCVNSAALRFVPLHQLEQEGYAEYLPLFAD